MHKPEGSLLSQRKVSLLNQQQDIIGLIMHKLEGSLSARFLFNQQQDMIILHKQEGSLSGRFLFNQQQDLIIMLAFPHFHRSSHSLYRNTLFLVLRFNFGTSSDCWTINFCSATLLWEKDLSNNWETRCRLLKVSWAWSWAAMPTITIPLGQTHTVQWTHKMNGEYFHSYLLKRAWLKV